MFSLNKSRETRPSACPVCQRVHSIYISVAHHYEKRNRPSIPEDHLEQLKTRVASSFLPSSRLDKKKKEKDTNILAKCKAALDARRS